MGRSNPVLQQEGMWQSQKVTGDRIRGEIMGLNKGVVEISNSVKVVQEETVCASEEN